MQGLEWNSTQATTSVKPPQQNRRPWSVKWNDGAATSTLQPTDSRPHRTVPKQHTHHKFYLKRCSSSVLLLLLSPTLSSFLKLPSQTSTTPQEGITQHKHLRTIQRTNIGGYRVVWRAQLEQSTTSRGPCYAGTRREPAAFCEHHTINR